MNEIFLFIGLFVLGSLIGFFLTLFINNLRYKYNKIPITSKKIQVIKKEQDYIVEGNLINSKYLVDPNNLFSIFKVNFDLLSKKDVLIESDNNFSFIVNKN